MKPGYEIILEKPERSFLAKLIKRKNRPLLSQAWHFHPEVEICFTKKSSGKRFVGNDISNYEDNDLVLLGSNLPHGFTTEMKCVQYVIHLNQDFFSNDFYLKPEFRNIKLMLSRAQRGLVFQGETTKSAKKVIKKIMKTDGFTQLLHLLELLHILSESDEVVEICSKEYALDFRAANLNRVKVVYNHILDNYMKDIRIKEIASLINLTEAAFFKFIKKETKKTFTQIINEFRINHATKLLMTTDKTIAEICFECGYNNISYFNRKFKEIILKTPNEFRVSYEEENT